MSSNTLIAIGASARALAHSVIRAGKSAYAIDMFADQDLSTVCPAVKIDRYPQGLLQALAAAPSAPWLYTGGLENHPRLVDRLATIRPLVGNPASVLRRVRDPDHLARVTTHAGCPMPNNAQTTRWLIKPKRGSGGLGVRFATAQELERPPRGTYLQPFIDGDSQSAVYVAAHGRARLLGVTRQLLGRDFQLARPFVYAGSLGPLALNPSHQNSLTRLGAVLAEAFHLSGLFNVDYVSVGDQIWPVEVNPRYSASIEVLERAMDFASIPLHLAAFASGSVSKEPLPSIERFLGKAVVYAQHDGVVPAGVGRLIAQLNEAGRPPLLADLPRIGEPLGKDQPVVTVFAEGSSLADVERQLRERAQAVRVALEL